MKKTILFPLETDVRDRLPFYEDYATVNRHIIQQLNERQAQDWQTIQAEELIAHAELVIEELMKKGNYAMNHSVMSTAYARQVK